MSSQLMSDYLKVTYEHVKGIFQLMRAYSNDMLLPFFKVLFVEMLYAGSYCIPMYSFYLSSVMHRNL